MKLYLARVWFNPIKNANKDSLFERKVHIFLSDFGTRDTLYTSIASGIFEDLQVDTHSMRYCALESETNTLQ